MWVIPGNNKENSSPPSRATVSSSRTHFLSFLAMIDNTRSPKACPIVSLIILNLSRSRNIMASFSLLRREWAIARVRRSLNNNLLGKLVRGSWKAMCLIFSSVRLRSVISLKIPIRYVFPAMFILLSFLFIGISLASLFSVFECFSNASITWDKASLGKISITVSLSISSMA